MTKYLYVVKASWKNVHFAYNVCKMTDSEQRPVAKYGADEVWKPLVPKLAQGMPSFLEAGLIKILRL